MPTGLVNQNQLVVLSNDLRGDIQALGKEQREAFGELLNKMVDIGTRLAVLETKHQQVERLDAEFKKHVELMTPIRDDVIGIRRMSRTGLVLAGLLPPIAGAIFSIWHPWTEDTRSQLEPVTKSIQDLKDRETVDYSSIRQQVLDQQLSIKNLSDVVTANQTRGRR